MNYDLVKKLAKEIGRSTRDLIVLTPANDPFYAGCPYRVRDAEWFANLWQAYGFGPGVHLRRIHYILVSSDGAVRKPDGGPYENTENDWRYLGRASLSARHLDLVPVEAFVDRRNDEPRIFAPDAVEVDLSVEMENASPDIWAPDFPDLPSLNLSGFHAEQDYLVEVWIEKSTQNDWLAPLCQQRGVNLVVGVGELSEVACRLLVERAREIQKSTRVLYISDFDPSGRSMPVAVARKIEAYCYKWDLGADITLRPIILTEEQCFEHRLPRIPIKESDRRKPKFEKRFGAGATELDAMEALFPGKMREVVNQEIDRYLDPTLDNRVSTARLRFQDRLAQIEGVVIEGHSEAIEELKSDYAEIEELFEDWEQRAEETWNVIHDELAPLAPEVSEEDIPTAEPGGDPEEPPLFDSKRDYFTQIDHYHDWQRR